MRGKNWLPILAITGAMTGLCAPAFGQTAPRAPTAPLQFADIGTITKWQAGGDRMLYALTNNNQWYKVTMLEPCMKLYPGQPLNFITETDTTTHERRSGIEVAHHQCTVTAIAKMDQPPPPPAAPAAPAPSAH